MEEIKKEADRLIKLFVFSINEAGSPIYIEDYIRVIKEHALKCCDEKIKTSNFVIKIYEEDDMINSDLSCQPVQFYNQVKEYIKQNY